ncbi:MAG: hypothetical protein WCK82_12930 [Bacteroidota bacterium]
MTQNKDIVFFDNLKQLFKRKINTISVGDIGIYHDVLSIGTFNDGNHALNYDIYAKIKALVIYENLIEIEVIDVVTLNACNEDVKRLIDTNMPKYINPKYIKWEIK